MASEGRRHDDVELITDARKSPLEGWHKRRRLYMVLQAIRLPLFALSGVVWWATHNQLLAVLIVCVSLPLPWVAVLIANEPGEVDKKSRSVYKPGLVRQQRLAMEQQRTSQIESSAKGSIAPPTPPTIIDYEDPHDD